MNGKCYILSWQGPDLGSLEHLVADENKITLGQTPDCDVRFPNEGPYADEVYAVIKPSRSADGWQLIPVSAFVKTLVNGTPVELTHYLQSGDRITFSEGESEIRFEIRKDRQFASSSGKLFSLSKWVYAAMLAAAVVLVGLALYGGFQDEINQNAREEALTAAKQSIKMIRVDSVSLFKIAGGDTTIIQTYPKKGESGMTEIGTAFLTEDGLLVTARHCIEPWLNFKEMLFLEQDSTRIPEYVAMALKAETYNQTHNDGTSLKLVSYCSVSGIDAPIQSTDFCYDNTRDEIVEVGDFDHDLYWRSIVGRHNKEDMMFGDIAVTRSPTGQKSVIRRAKEKMIRGWLRADKEQLMFYGFPSAGSLTPGSGTAREFQPGEMILLYDDSLNPGFSGAPALVFKRGKVYTVGVVSTYTKGSKKDYIYLVPITELEHIVKP